MRTLTFNRAAILAGDLILVNEGHPIRQHVRPHEMVPVDERHPAVLLNPRAQAMLARLLGALDAQDEIVPVSGFRNWQEQARIYADCLRENGPEFTRQYVALPDASEHQTGLAIDLGENKPGIDFIRPDFARGVCRRFRERAAEHGFLERYPAGKEAITGIACEPWHFRYVGYPHALIMRERALTLEEYTDYVRGFPAQGRHLAFAAQGRVFEVFFAGFPAGADEINLALPGEGPYQVSGNNVDGLVVTLWGKVA
jgi:zinc D-Ala-D-Ala dipeptidase/carboxypeptidase